MTTADDASSAGTAYTSWVPSMDRIPLEDAAYVYSVFIAVWCMAGAWAYIRYAKRKSDEYGSRVVSILHAVVSSVLCGLAAMEGYGSDPTWGTFGTRCTGLQQVAILCSAAYFVMDFFGILLSSYFSWLFLGHHILSGGCLAYAGLVGVHGFEFTMVTLLMELSNPFLHSRWLLMEDKEHLKRNGRGSIAFQLIDSSFYVVFFVARIVAGPVMTYNLLAAGNSPLVIRGAGVLLQTLSVQFMFESFGKRFRGEPWQ